MSIKREELAKRYSDTVAAIEKIKNADESFLYHTKDKYLPKVGHIHEIDSIEGILKAQNKVNANKEQVYDSAAKDLGITEAEMPKNDTKLMGMKTSYWDKDIKTRLNELRLEIRLAKLEKDEELLRGHLGKDEQFSLDMLELSDETVETVSAEA
jgi:hypothetical protein